MTEAVARESLSVAEALREARDRLRPSPSSSLDAQLLLAHVLASSRAHLLAHGEVHLTVEQTQSYASVVARRSLGTPVAYLRGETEWYGSSYVVTPDVLIPRPETELLLERAVCLARERAARIVVDVGTGSGAIASQLAIRLPGVTVYATDISPPALKVAAENLRRLAVDEHVRLLQGNLVEPLPEAPDLIVANLPYLSAEMMDTLDRDVRFEPVTALYGGATGLELYRQLMRQVVERGWSCPLLFEIDPRQALSMQTLIETTMPGRDVTIERDYAGHDRVVIVTLHD